MSDFAIYNNMPRIMPAPSGIQAPSAGGIQTPSLTPGSDKGDSFGGVLKDAINQVSELEKGSQNELHKFMNNDSDLHSVMISLEKADMSFQVMMQVRNKIVSAYQEIMKAQV